MKRTNNQTNLLIQGAVVAADFLLLNAVLGASALVSNWMEGHTWSCFMACNLAMAAAEYQFPPMVQERMISAGNIVKRIIQLTLAQAIVAYVVLKVSNYHAPVGRVLLVLDGVLAAVLLLSRLVERLYIKRFRSAGRNTRKVTFVGSDEELQKVYTRLVTDTTTGYRFLGYYADEEMGFTPRGERLTRLGSISSLLSDLKDGTALIGDELYLCVSRQESQLIRTLSKYCERHVRRFFFVPVASEVQRVALRREEVEDLEIYTSVESPLLSPLNKTAKRTFDLAFSGLFLLCSSVLYPVIALVIKMQSPGPVLFRQERTGLDGRTFTMLKFRSMHVNDKADTLQATKDDPRKFPFGSWMRRTNIDELPQFWNVLKGDMSVVGPRPHMLAHTEQYAGQIDKYMVRHFVKPGITGWAQVTGYRGETRELWQMEERVRRDIWYMEHWTIWLDIRIVWLTVKGMLLGGDQEAY